MKLNVRKTMIGSAAAALLLLAAPAEAADLPGAVGMLPKNTGFAVAVDMEAFKRPTSVLARVPYSHFQGEMAKEFETTGIAKPSESALEAAGRIAVHPSNTLAMHTLAIGASFSPDMSENQQYATILGNFTQANAFAYLKTYGVGPGPNRTGLFPSETGAEIYVSVPKDGVILFSDNMEWLLAAPDIAQNRAGMMAPDSAFNASVSSMGGRMPEVILFGDGPFMKQGANANPMVAMQLGPLTQYIGTTRGMSLAVFPGAQPSVELHSSFNDAAGAAGGAAAFKQFMDLMVSQTQMAINFSPQITDEEKAGAQEAIEYMRGVQAMAQGNSVVTRFPIGSLPSPEEGQQKVLETIEEVKQQLGAMGGGF